MIKSSKLGGVLVFLDMPKILVVLDIILTSSLAFSDKFLSLLHPRWS